jgi:para-aminobenzoate synthetase component 1
MLNKNEAIHRINELGQIKCPFLFVIDYSMENNLVFALEDIDVKELKYSINNKYSNFKSLINIKEVESLKLKSFPLSFNQYQKAYSLVNRNLNFGNSFLANLTVETPIEISFDLEELFQISQAKYKLWIKDKFVCFSPETFVSVDKLGKISSFPMKGTIDADLSDAANQILKDPKEQFEHTTIVDLIRNDLSKICNKVWVQRFRYLEKIKKSDGGSLLQVSSEVCGQLPPDWENAIGNWLFELLPAGSITGAPKDSTLRIINEAEQYTYKNSGRGFYSGIFGIFDGQTLNSAVLIRFIEKTRRGLVFKSGGGLTNRSDPKKEYEELISKIYVPVF